MSMLSISNQSRIFLGESPLVNQRTNIETTVEVYMTSIKEIVELSQKTFLTLEDEAHIRKQLTHSLNFLQENRESLIKEVQLTEDQFVYITPQKQGFEKVGKFKNGGFYNAAHLQIDAKGHAYLIPMHFKLQCGSGAYKRVRIGLEEVTGKVVAAASIRNTSPLKMVQEVNLIKMNHENIAFALNTKPGKATTKGKLILPYAQHGDLLKYVGADKNSLLKKKFSEREIVQEIIRCVRDQHDSGIINHDLKLPNFLLTEEDGRPRIMCLDRGLSSLREDSIQSHMQHGTALYQAPECYSTKINTMEKVDIYALGVTLWALYQNKPIDDNFENPLPWLQTSDIVRGRKNPNGFRFLYALSKRNYLLKHPEFRLPPDGKPRNIEQLVAWMTDEIAHRRPNIQQVEEAFNAIPYKEAIDKFEPQQSIVVSVENIQDVTSLKLWPKMDWARAQIFLRIKNPLKEPSNVLVYRNVPTKQRAEEYSIAFFDPIGKVYRNIALSELPISNISLKNFVCDQLRNYYHKKYPGSVERFSFLESMEILEPDLAV